jgi:hypothetical protein
VPVRAQTCTRVRDGKSIAPVDGDTERASSDFQSLCLVKLLSSAPLSEPVICYFYGIFAGKGRNGEAVIEDAGFRHDDLSDTDTICKGIDTNSLSLTASCYFMRNVKGVAGVNVDSRDSHANKGTCYAGHLTREDYILFGFDAAFQAGSPAKVIALRWSRFYAGHDRLW